jgi:ketosteroid isomerase-like protein
LNGKFDLKVKRVLQSSDFVLVTMEWSFSGTGPDGNPVSLSSKSADVLRKQDDGTWRFVIDNPWGTE